MAAYWFISNHKGLGNIENVQDRHFGYCEKKYSFWKTKILNFKISIFWKIDPESSKFQTKFANKSYYSR